MTAAALLRRLEATTGPRDFSDLTRQERFERVAAWHATRNLLPLLAGLVEAVGRHEELMGMIRRRGKQATMEAIMEARGGISAAYAALEAAAAKEGTK